MHCFLSPVFQSSKILSLLRSLLSFVIRECTKDFILAITFLGIYGNLKFWRKFLWKCRSIKIWIFISYIISPFHFLFFHSSNQAQLVQTEIFRSRDSEINAYHMAGGCDRKKVSSSPLRRFSTHYSEMDGGLLENQMIKLYILECFKPTTAYSRMASNLRI